MRVSDPHLFWLRPARFRCEMGRGEKGLVPMRLMRWSEATGNKSCVGYLWLEEGRGWASRQNIESLIVACDLRGLWDFAHSNSHCLYP